MQGCFWQSGASSPFEKNQHRVVVVYHCSHDCLRAAFFLVASGGGDCWWNQLTPTPKLSAIQLQIVASFSVSLLPSPLSWLSLLVNVFKPMYVSRNAMCSSHFRI
jgi:hypothetical protein